MDRIGRYHILGELGRGAMGIVYRAQDPAIGRTVAIKTIRLGELADPEERSKLRERLLREAQSAGVLSHPGIVTIYDVAEEGDVAYVAMECVDGPTLEKLFASDPPDGQLALSILSQTAAALDYAHKRGIVHRDIKPANIMIHERSVAKITDFGVAKIQSHQVTQSGAMVGTPNYMSPEQIQGKQVDGRSDQYSLAVISYELLTGEKPFSSDSIASLAFKIVNEDPAPVHRLNPTLGWTADTVIRKGLAKQPEDRYPTCSDFVFALENACRACKDWKPLAVGASQNIATMVDARAPLPPAAGAERQPDRQKPQRRRQRVPVVLRIARLLALAVLGAALVCAILIGALRYFTEEPPATTQVVEDKTVSRTPRPSAMGEGMPAPTLPAGETTPSQPAPNEPAPAPTGGAAPPPEERVVEAKPQPAKPKTPLVTPEHPASQGVEARLVTNPPGAYMVVDGSSQYSCKSPCTVTLPSGRHTLAASMEGYRRTLKIFELPAETENFLNLERANGTVAVRSEPKGASILVNGQQRPEKTPAMLTLPTGKYSIEVVRDGRSERQDVVVRDSVITNVAIEFPER